MQTRAKYTTEPKQNSTKFLLPLASLFFLADLAQLHGAEHSLSTESSNKAEQACIPRLIEKADSLFAPLGISLLHVAVKRNDLHMVKHLVQHLSFNVHCTTRADHGQITPLYIACQNGYIDMVRFLVNAGADVNKQNGAGRTPVHTAAAQGHLKIVQTLALHDANINAVDHENKTSLRAAIEAGKTRVALWLIRAGAGIQIEDLEAGCGSGRFRAITIGALHFLHRHPSTKRLFEIVVQKIIEGKKQDLGSLILTDRGKRDAALCRLLFPTVKAPAIFIDAGNQTARLIKKFRSFLMSKKVPSDIANSICFEF